MYLTEKPLDLFQPSINIDNVQAILSQSNLNLSSNAEKCKEFIKLHMNSNAGKNGPPNMSALMSFMNQKVGMPSGSKQCETGSESELNGNDVSSKTESSQRNRTTAIEAGIDLAKLYIDNKLMEFEQNLTRTINERFDEIERRQNEQFQMIVAMLQKTHRD